MVTEIRKRLKECQAKAEAFYGEELPKYSIKFDLTGTTAGQCVYDNVRKRYKLRFNKTLAKENPEEFLADTVPHELAHLIQVWQDRRKGTRSKPHGPEWKRIMITVFRIPPHVTHKYDTTTVARNTKPYTWTCTGCNKQFQVSNIKHSKMKKQQHRCTRCHHPVEFAGKLNKIQFKEGLKKKGLTETEL